jgi:hypothetical protein
VPNRNILKDLQEPTTISVDRHRELISIFGISQWIVVAQLQHYCAREPAIDEDPSLARPTSIVVSGSWLGPSKLEPASIDFGDNSTWTYNDTEVCIASLWRKHSHVSIYWVDLRLSCSFYGVWNDTGISFLISARKKFVHRFVELWIWYKKKSVSTPHVR